MHHLLLHSVVLNLICEIVVLEVCHQIRSCCGAWMMFTELAHLLTILQLWVEIKLVAIRVHAELGIRSFFSIGKRSSLFGILYRLSVGLKCHHVIAVGMSGGLVCFHRTTSEMI